MRLCVQREGAAHLRDRLTLRYLARLYARNCDYLIINAVSLRHCFQSGRVAEAGSHFYPIFTLVAGG